MASAFSWLLTTRLQLSIFALLLLAVLCGGCGFHFGNQWGSRPRLLHRREEQKPAPTPSPDHPTRRRRFGEEGEAPPVSSALPSDDDHVRYGALGERLLNHADSW